MPFYLVYKVKVFDSFYSADKEYEKTDEFYWCISLTDISIPNSVRKIERYAFSGCKSLKSLYIPNSVRTIGDGVFKFCESLKSIYIPNSVRTIGEEAFTGCKSLERIEIPKGSLKKFARLLPNDQDKLVEINVTR